MVRHDTAPREARPCCSARCSSPRPRSPSAPGAAQAFTLHVLHINDFHSRIEAINAFDSTCSDEEEAAGECFGGAARLFTAINELRDRADRGRRTRGRARRRRRVPGLALLHHLLRPGRGRDDEPHRLRRHGLRQPRVRPRAGAAGQVHRDRRVPGDLRQRRRGERALAGRPRRGARAARRRRRAGGDRRRHHARHPRDRLAWSDGRLPRPGGVPQRQGGGAGGRGRRQGHRGEPSRRSRRHRGRRGGVGHRPDRRRAQPHAVLQHRRGRALPLPAHGDRPGRAPGADRAGGRLLEVPRPHRADLRRRAAW